MKILRTYVLSAVIALCSLGSYAQNKPAPVNEPDHNKPKLFEGLPDRVLLSADELSGLFSTAHGRPAAVRLSENARFQFEGEVVSSGNQPGTLTQNLLIRSTNFAGAAFSVSKTTRADGSVVYSGRIISFRHGDAYELQNQNGQYALVKKSFYHLVNE